MFSRQDGVDADEETAPVRVSQVDGYDEDGHIESVDLSRTNNADVSSSRETSPSSPSRSIIKSFTSLVTPGPYAALAAATVIQTCAGLTYSFGVYSEDLREVFGGSESDVAFLGTVKDAGAYFGLPGGFLYDTCGPFITLVVGAVMHVFGFLGVYKVLKPGSGGVSGDGFFSNNSSSPSLPWMSFVIFTASNGNSLFDTAALLACMSYFPNDQAQVSGVLKAYLGLSSAVFQQLYATFIPVNYGDDSQRSAQFVLFVALVGGVVAIIGAPFFLVRRGSVRAESIDGIATEERDAEGSLRYNSRLRDTANVSGPKELRSKVFSQLNFVVVALVVTVSIAAFVNDPPVCGIDAPAVWVNCLVTLVVFILLFTPWVLFFWVGAFGEKKYLTNENGASPMGTQSEEDDLTGPLLGDVHRDSSRDNSPMEDVIDLESSTISSHDRLNTPTPPLRGQKLHALSLCDSLRSTEQWLLFITISLSSGAAMCLVNNLDQVSNAVGSAPGVSSALVSVFSICNCLGRLIGGELSELVFRRWKISRVACLAFSQVAVAVGVGFVSVVPTPAGLFTAVAVVGSSLGHHWGSLPTIVTELFGQKHVGAIYGWLSVSPMIGSYLLSTQAFGDTYDRELAKQIKKYGGDGSPATSDDHSNHSNPSMGNQSYVSCMGGECFANAFWIGGACAMLGAALTLILAKRCRHLYEHLHRKFVA